MTQILRRGQSHHGAEGWDWRRVPQVSLLPQEQTSAITPLVVALMVALAVVATVDLYIFRDLSAAEKRVADAQSELDVVSGRLDDVESTFADVEDQLLNIDALMEQTVARGEEIGREFQDLTSARVNWPTGMTAVMGADGGDIRINRLVTEPTGVIRVSGVLAKVEAVGGFQEHLRQMSEVLELQSLQVESGESVLIFYADIEVR